MRIFSQFIYESFYSQAAKDYMKNIKFSVIHWNTNDNVFKAIINGEVREFKFYGYENYPEIIKKIESYYQKSKSARKTIDYIEKRFAKLLPRSENKASTKSTGKFVRCPECEQAMQISGNRPGTVCPNCGEGILELY